MRFDVFALAALAGSLGLALPASLQAAESLTLFGSTLTYPQPLWATEDGDHSRVNRKEGGPVFRLDIVRKEEDFQKWTGLYSVFASEKASNDKAGADPVKATGRPYQMACGRQNFMTSRIGGDERSETYLFLCTNSPGLPVPGYGEGIGEVAIYRFFDTPGARVRLSYQWKGAKFSADDRSSWPVSEADFTKMLDRINGAKVTAAN